MAAMCRMNSYECVQKFAHGSDTEGPNPTWSRRALLSSLSGWAAASPWCDTISPACVTGLQRQWDKSPSEAQSGVPCAWVYGTRSLVDSLQQRERFSVHHFPKYEIQPFYMIDFLYQNHIGDLYNCCCRIFVKNSQLHHIIQMFTACRLYWDESYCLPFHSLGISKLSHFPKRYNEF